MLYRPGGFAYFYCCKMTDVRKNIEDTVRELRIRMQCLICMATDYAVLYQSRCCRAIACETCLNQVLEPHGGGWWNPPREEIVIPCPLCLKHGWRLMDCIKQTNMAEITQLVEKLVAMTQPFISSFPQRRSILIRADIIDAVFPGLLKYPGVVSLTGWDVNKLNILSELRGLSGFIGIEDVATELHLYIRSTADPMMVGKHWARFLAGKRGRPQFVQRAFLPETLTKPEFIQTKFHLVDFVYAWIYPFLLDGSSEVVSMMLSSVGLDRLESRNLDCSIPHKERTTCRCVRCEVKAEVKNYLLHSKLMSVGKPYYVWCFLCGVKVDFEVMPAHVESAHKRSFCQKCRDCGSPLTGPFEKAWPHRVECPLRQCPLALGHWAVRGRVAPPARNYRIPQLLGGVDAGMLQFVCYDTVVNENTFVVMQYW